ncbi:lysosomal proton-coupled steroid conjugate and bile acid symporter SLC46A3 [Pituophis catenifer annectens]|uniref:lysosomal proton-coupled steroid conjugate and bile acid symporter SLC46A3 n=1 Tax=Pituophis catenifer annectens TaxID=94852 RepID=UPI00399629F2
MKKTLLLEPAISLYIFAYSLTTPLKQQYVYKRIWEETTNSTFIVQDNMSHCELNQSNPTYVKQKEVQEKASLFAMKTDLCGAIFSILVAFVLVANGDRYGRKISLVLPLMGSLTSSIFLFVMSDLSLPLYLFFVFSLVGGLFGDLATFLGGAFSFVVDCCETQKQKTIRIAVVDLIFGFTSGLGGLVSGYILKEIDFMWTFAMISLFHMVNIFYVIFCLDETVKVSAIRTQSWREGLKDTLSGVYMLFKSSSCKKRILIILLLCTFMTYLFTVFGGLSLYVLYELNAPLCWDAIYIGYGSAVSTSVSVTGFLGIVFLSRYLRDSYLVFIGIFSYMGGSIMTAFANTTLLMMLVRIPSMLLFIPIPVIRAMLSKIVLPNEQGALFACIACLEVVTGTISITVFNTIYAVTVAWFPGFSFLFSAGFCIIPLSLMSWFMYVTRHEEDYAQLPTEEGCPGQNDNS